MNFRLPHKATAWTLLAGVSYVLCFPRFDLPALSVLFLPSLLMAIHALETRRQAVKLGFLLSFLVGIGGFHWIVYVSQNFGEMPLPVAVLLLLGFCLIAAPQMVAFLALAEHLRFRMERLPLASRPAAWAALYVALEYLAHFVKIFPENLGNTLIAFPSLAQAAALGGVPLLSFVPLFLGASVFYARKHGVRAAPAVVAALVLAGGLQLWGARERTRLAAAPSETLRIGFVQHNMDDAEKRFAHTSAREVVTILLTQLLGKTKELAAQKPDLILWAETSYPMTFPLRDGGMVGRGGTFAFGSANLVSSEVKAMGVPLLFGGYVSELAKDYNAGVLLGADGRVADRYLKQVLLIFGEYFPFDDWFPDLKKLNPIMGDFGRGPGPVPVKFRWRGGEIPLGVNICYEAILPEYSRGYALNGARALVNLTKDSWFGDTFEPWQHFQLSVPRAIELRIPLIRATNTGLSGVVDPDGTTRLLSEPFHEAYQVLEVKVPLQPEKSPYVLFGEWFAQTCVIFALGIFVWSRKKSPQLALSC